MMYHSIASEESEIQIDARCTEDMLSDTLALFEALFYRVELGFKSIISSQCIEELAHALFASA
jgi:hypothetical protein